MGTSQFAFVRMPPGKWASYDSLREFLRPAFRGAILGRTFDPDEEAGQFAVTGFFGMERKRNRRPPSP
jgi:hypothetical protein